MKRIVLSLAWLALLIGNYAYATTYTYTGDSYTIGGGAYTDLMSVTGTLVTSSPIPPNFGGDISGILTSWSFNDGVQTINSSNGVFHPGYPLQVSTNEEGVIVDTFLAVFLSPMATTVGDTDSYIGLVFGQSIGVVDAVCTTVVEGFCDAYEPPASYGQASSPGTWAGCSISSGPIAVSMVNGAVGLNARRARHCTGKTASLDNNSGSKNTLITSGCFLMGMELSTFSHIQVAVRQLLAACRHTRCRELDGLDIRSRLRSG